MDAEQFWESEYISKVEWRFAKTMPKHPHWYTVRWDRPDMESMFVDFAWFIRDHGYEESFYRKKLMYFNIGDWKYWTMGNPITAKKTYILNRAKIENVYGGNDGINF